MSEENKTQETGKEDILDQVRKAEKVVKTHLLIKRLVDLKKLARQVLEAKEESRLLLSDIGISEDDAKRVIDFINALPEIQLSDEDKMDIRDRVRDEGKKARKEVQERIEKSPAVFTGLTSANGFYSNATGSSLQFVDSNTTSTGGITLTSGANSVNLNL